MPIYKKPIIVSGAAGFIGSALCERLLQCGENIIGIDNLNNYYDVSLKLDRLKNIERVFKLSNANWIFYETSIEDISFLNDIFKECSPKFQEVDFLR